MGVTVGVFGAAGRMGATVCRAVAADPEVELAAAVDPGAAGEPLRTVAGVESDLEIAGKAEHLEDRPRVMGGSTHVAGARENLAWCAAHGVNAVVGTTCFSDDD